MINNASLVYNLYGSQTAGYLVVGNGGFFKSGAGLLSITGTSNNMTGNTSITGGTLSLANGSLYCAAEELRKCRCHH